MTDRSDSTTARFSRPSPWRWLLAGFISYTAVATAIVALIRLTGGGSPAAAFALHGVWVVPLFAFGLSRLARTPLEPNAKRTVIRVQRAGHDGDHVELRAVYPSGDSYCALVPVEHYRRALDAMVRDAAVEFAGSEVVVEASLETSEGPAAAPEVAVARDVTTPVPELEIAN